MHPDVLRVRDDRVVDTTIATTERRTAPVLSDAVVLELAELRRRIESHYGCPQDIE